MREIPIISLRLQKRPKKNKVQILETRAAEHPPPHSVQTLLDSPMVEYSPPHRVSFTPMRLRWQDIDPFTLFIRFLGEAAIAAIVDATNTYASQEMGPRQHCARDWHLLTRGEFLCWLGLLLYMANYIQIRRQDHWLDSQGIVASHMGQKRWEQIHRYLTFNPTPSTQHTSFFDKLEPVASMIRTSCQQAVYPSSWHSVDETIIAFKGRSKHTVRMQRKPVSEGYKIWVLACRSGFVEDWLFYSPIEGTQHCLHRKNRLYYQPVPLMPVYLAPTYQVPIVLMERLVSRYPYTNCVVFLDNLFLTIDVAHVLLQMHIGVMGTTRSNYTNIPPLLKDVNRLNHILIYGGLLLIQCCWVLCFAWQDNNIVLGITTAHSMHRAEDFIVRERWRPKDSATNAIIAHKVFKDEKKKYLPIPCAIDDYNHGMNAVDVHNQLRKSFSSQQLFERRI